MLGQLPCLSHVLTSLYLLLGLHRGGGLGPGILTNTLNSSEQILNLHVDLNVQFILQRHLESITVVQILEFITKVKNRVLTSFVN